MIHISNRRAQPSLLPVPAVSTFYPARPTAGYRVCLQNGALYSVSATSPPGKKGDSAMRVGNWFSSSMAVN